MTRKTLYEWMDKQIEACDIINSVPNPKDPFFIKVAGSDEKQVHIYNIDNLCKVLGLKYTVEPQASGNQEYHYVMYKGYKFFGLEDRKWQSI